jgi:hypothetical protein
VRGGVFAAMPRAIMRLVATLTELLKVRELNPKFNRRPKRQPRANGAASLKGFELNMSDPYQHE